MISESASIALCDQKFDGPKLKTQMMKDVGWDLIGRAVVPERNLVNYTVREEDLAAMRRKGMLLHYGGKLQSAAALGIPLVSGTAAAASSYGAFVAASTVETTVWSWSVFTGWVSSTTSTTTAASVREGKGKMESEDDKDCTFKLQRHPRLQSPLLRL